MYARSSNFEQSQVAMRSFFSRKKSFFYAFLAHPFLDLRGSGSARTGVGRRRFEAIGDGLGPEERLDKYFTLSYKLPSGRR